MENQTITGNAHELQLLDLKCVFGGWPDRKTLTVGLGSGLVTKKLLSLDIKPFSASLKPSEQDYYLYARAKHGEKSCSLEIGHEAKADTDTDYLILLKRAKFEEMDFTIIQL